MNDHQDPATRRNAERVPTNFPGKVIIPGRHPLNCVVRDMSEDGALMEFKAAIWLPPRFHLHVDAMGTEAYCELRHQRSTRVGVKFVRVTVKQTDEPKADAEPHRTADQWEPVDEQAAMPGQPAPSTDDMYQLHGAAPSAHPAAPVRDVGGARDGGFGQAAPSAPARGPRQQAAPAPAPAAPAAAPAPDRDAPRSGSAIRANMRATQAAAQAEQKSLIGRLFGR